MPKAPQFNGWRLVGYTELFRKGDVIAYHGIKGHLNATPETGEKVSLDYHLKATPKNWNWQKDDSYWSAYRRSDTKFIGNLPDKPLFKIKLPLP